VVIRACLQSGMPLIMDIGEAYMHETQVIVDMARELDADLTINHNPGHNPATAAQHNLKIMDTYKAAFNVPVGLSDHYRGDLMLYAASAMGANMLEKGVVDNADAAEADIVSACEFSELKTSLPKVRESWEARGDGQDWTTGDRDLSGRAGMVAVRDLKAGETPTLSDLRWAWPPLGVTSDHWAALDGKALVQDAGAGTPITWAHFGVDRHD